VRTRASIPDRVDDAKLAQAILADIGNTPVAAVAAPVAPQTVYVDRAAPAAVTAGGSTGAIIGQAYDALSLLKQHSAELPPEAKAPLDDILSILQPGSPA
jgi:hypothetical protein